MDESRLSTIAQIEEFLSASTQVEFSAHSGDTERYAHISRVLKRFDYPRRNKHERGVLLAYLRHISGYSRPQLTRLVARWHANRLAAVPLAKRYAAPGAPFARKYTPGDIALLVEMDRANEDVCGPAIAHLLQRAYNVYGDARYERLATLSVSHLYNLRKSTGYRALRVSLTKTHPVCNPIGVRRAPRPNGRAGFVRIDTVHQGDLDGIKGVYHITCALLNRCTATGSTPGRRRCRARRASACLPWSVETALGRSRLEFRGAGFFWREHAALGQGLGMQVDGLRKRGHDRVRMSEMYFCV